MKELKVKLFDFDTTDIEEMQNTINLFIKDKDIIDIKYATAGENCSYWITALVLYKK